MRNVLLCALILTCTAGAEPLRHPVKATRVVDLTHPIHEEMPVWPGGVPFKKTLVVDYAQGYRAHRFEMGENTGTHVDAPAHFIAGKRPIDAIEARDLVAPAVVVDVRAKAAQNPDYRVSSGDLLAWEQRHGQIPAGALIIANTGWHRRFTNTAQYANFGPDGRMHFPGYGPDAALLAVRREAAGVAIDTLSVDHGPSNTFDVHRIMLEAGRYQIENLANLDALPPAGATVIVGVLPVKDGTQAQARVLALVP